MKPAKFKYHRASSVEEALSLLSEHGYDAKLLAGGQSLVPAMNFRLAQPAVLIDLNFIQDLSYVKEDKKKGVLIGPMTRHRFIEKNSIIQCKAPLLHQTMPFIAHPQIRNRGTIGGSIVHADPAAELPAIALALNASFRIRNKNGERWVEAQDFFTGMFSTAMEPDEILIEIAIPNAPDKRYGYSFNEVARRHGDYAIVGAGVSLTLDKKNRCEDIKIVFLSVGDAPVFAKEACAAMKGQVFSEELVKNVAEIAATKDIDPGSDIHASAKYRRHLAKVLTTKNLLTAFQQIPK